MLLQQGDVLLYKQSSLPKGLKPVQRDLRRGYVLAEGEVTGHAHCIDADIELMLDEAGTMYMKNSDEVTLTHEEHHTKTIPPGIWKIGIVQEYDHFAEEARKVQD
jgi:hypothetical protein